MVYGYIRVLSKEQNVYRQTKDIASAKTRGVKFGSEPMVLPENFEEAKHYFKCGRLSGRKADELCGMSSSSF